MSLPPRLVAVLVVVGLALSVWQGGLARTSDAAHWCVLGVIVVTFVAAVMWGHGRQTQTSRKWVVSTASDVASWRRQPPLAVISVVVWAVLLSATVAWDATSFAEQAHRFPTLSYFIGHVTRLDAGRAAFFALWLVLGVSIAMGGRARSGPKCP
jgi:hypothetical protein